MVLKYGDDAPHDERALLRDIVKTPVGQAVNEGYDLMPLLSMSDFDIWLEVEPPKVQLSDPTVA